MGEDRSPPSLPHEEKKNPPVVEVYVRKREKQQQQKHHPARSMVAAAESQGHGQGEEDAVSSPLVDWYCDPLELSRFTSKYARKRRTVGVVVGRGSSSSTTTAARPVRRSLKFGPPAKKKVKVKVKVKDMARNKNKYLFDPPFFCSDDGIVSSCSSLSATVPPTRKVKMKVKEMARNRNKYLPDFPFFNCDDDGEQYIVSPSERGGKSKQRSSRTMRVQLDQESIRLWKNLHECQYENYMEDADKKQFWSKERQEIAEHVTSFLSHARGILGDRKFVPWKSSVLDSIVGAMLAQNVSDVLSSSVFMELVSRFPSKLHKDGSASQDEVINRSECAVKACEPEKMVKQDAGKKKGCLLSWKEFERTCMSKIAEVTRFPSVESIVDWRSVGEAEIGMISQVIERRGQNNRMAQRIKNLLTKLMEELESTNLEWLRAIHPNEMREFLSSIHGLGSKSIDCITLLTLQQKAFPVDTNVARICVRLGWVPIKLLPDERELHTMDSSNPVIKDIQMYLWPRLCQLDVNTLYELHYHMITFGKVFCKKSNPNCSACPMKMQCRYFNSVCASQSLTWENSDDIEDMIPKKMVKHEQKSTLKFHVRDLIAQSPKRGSVTTHALMKLSNFRTKHIVYEIPDTFLNMLEIDSREAKAPSSYFLLMRPSDCCENETDQSSETIKATILVPCQTALQGKFPLNGTFFQSNEVFADHHSSNNPIDVPKKLTMGLPTRTVYFGTSIQSICKGWSIDEISNCFNAGYICVRGFDRSTGSSHPLVSGLHDSPKKSMQGKRVKAPPAA